MAYLGWAIAHTDDVSRGLRCLKEGLALYDQVGLRIHLCLPICLLAEAYLKSKQYEKGMEQANLAMAISSEIGDRWCLPRVHAIRGRLLQTLGQGDAAETSLKMAVDVAAMQAAKGVQCLFKQQPDLSSGPRPPRGTEMSRAFSSLAMSPKDLAPAPLMSPMARARSAARAFADADRA